MIIQQKDIEISMYLKFLFYISISSTKGSVLARVRVALGFMLDSGTDINLQLLPVPAFSSMAIVSDVFALYKF